MTTDQHTRRNTAAQVDIIENPRLTAKRQDAFVARNETRPDVTTVETDAAGVRTEHTRPGTITMYKPSETQGWVPRTVSVSSIRLLLKQGWQEFCPDCRKEHLDRNGVPTTDPNACTARPPVAVRVCPVCRKRIYDNMGIPAPQDNSDDPNVIAEEEIPTTPAGRTRVQLDLHLWSKHPRQAQMMGRPPLPTALKEIAEAVQASVS